ncbi:MAG: glycosyltransferase family 4 protein [Acidimicrobiales bacterium]
MTAGLRIAVVKPDFGVAGGFERLLDRLLDHLRSQGHRPHIVAVDARRRPTEVWGLPIDDHKWVRHPELFHYLGLTEAIRRLDLSRYDIALSTQPPSFLAPHPRTVALFYHQARVFYDLAEPWVAAGFGEAELHHEAVEAVRAVDQAHLGGVVHWLAGSEECQRRLAEYWSIVDSPTTRVSVLHAGPDLRAWPSPKGYQAAGPVVCVSRHEWPKRTELVVAAAHLLPDVPVEILGGGGRLPVLTSLDAQLAQGSLDPEAIDDAALWANRGHVDPAFEPVTGAGRAGLTIAGAVSNRRRDRAYDAASAVVAPAYREDYGLTAVEAMAWGRPVIVCRDGGGLVELVEGTGTGLVVEPTAGAIAAAIRSLRADPQQAAQMAARAREVASEFTWERTFAELDDAVLNAASTRR